MFLMLSYCLGTLCEEEELLAVYDKDVDVMDMMEGLLRPFLFLSLGDLRSWVRGFVHISVFLCPCLGCM